MTHTLEILQSVADMAEELQRELETTEGAMSEHVCKLRLITSSLELAIALLRTKQAVTGEVGR